MKQTHYSSTVSWSLPGREFLPPVGWNPCRPGPPRSPCSSGLLWAAPQPHRIPAHDVIRSKPGCGAGQCNRTERYRDEDVWLAVSPSLWAKGPTPSQCQQSARCSSRWSQQSGEAERNRWMNSRNPRSMDFWDFRFMWMQVWGNNF